MVTCHGTCPTRTVPRFVRRCSIETQLSLFFFGLLAQHDPEMT